MDKRFPVNVEIKLAAEFGGNAIAERSSSNGLYSVMQDGSYLSSDVPYEKIEKIRKYAGANPELARAALELLAYRR